MKIPRISKFLDNNTGIGEYDRYLSSIEASFCPYIAPSRRRAQIFFSTYFLEVCSLPEVYTSIFLLGVVHAELLRRNREEESHSAALSLACQNIVLELPQEMDVGRRVLDIPHWLLKHEYTSCNILFGKFWKGHAEPSRTGQPLPPCPCYLLSIRQAILPLDHRFFSKSKHLMTLLDDQDFSGGAPLHEQVLTDRDFIQMTARAWQNRRLLDLREMFRYLMESGLERDLRLGLGLG